MLLVRVLGQFSLISDESRMLNWRQDRGSIGNARIMGFQADLHLSEDQFYNCLMIFCGLAD